MSDTTTIVRLLKFISLLSSTTRRTAKEFADFFEVDKSTISRYRRTLEEVGYVIQKDSYHQLYIDKTNPRLDAQLHFDEEEAQLLTGLLRANDSPRQKDLLNKIYYNSPLPQLAASTAEAQLAKRYRLLREAMHKEQQVLLLSYASMNGSDKRDRKVEPIRFIRNDQLIEAFEVDSLTTKHFQLDRMADVRPLHVPFQHKKMHKTKTTDPFHIADVELVEIHLEMSLRAGQRMKEEFERSTVYLYENKEHIYYKGPVNAQFINLDRWLMGWCDELRILRPDSLRQHLEKRWSERKY
jgi:predicted DNA-binding transcriptional regulator YafY